MIISLALLAPIAAVLFWIYVRTAKRRLGTADYLALALIILLVVAGTVMTHRLVGSSDSSLWVYVLAPMVGYGVLLVGMGLVFWMRR